MDHRVSKDMISSGMTPSGQKNQKELGGSQYGSAATPNSLVDAYRSIYEHHQKDENGNTVPHDEDVKEGKINPGLQAYLDKKKGKKGGDDEDHDDEKKGKKGKGGKPDFLDLDKDGDTKEPMKKAAKEKKESVDLVSAYHSIYEKSEPEIVDEENLDEALPLLAAPLVAKGLMALKGGLAAAKATKAGVMAAKGISAATKAGGAFKKGLMTAKKTGALNKITQSGGKLLGKKPPKVPLAQKAGSMVRSAGAAMKNNPMNTALGATMIPSMTGGGGGQAAAQPKPPRLYSDLDLFDVVKGVLVNEGLDEDTATKVMIELPTLTNEEIIEIENEVNAMSEQQLNELIAPAVALGARKLASTAAKRGLGTAVKKGAAMAGKALAGSTGVKATALAAKKVAPMAKKVGSALIGKTATGRAVRAGAALGASYLKGRSDADSSRKNKSYGYVDDF